MQAMEFAQSKGNARRDGSTGITFSDVGGLGNTINEMMQVVEVSTTGTGAGAGQAWLSPIPASWMPSKGH